MATPSKSRPTAKAAGKPVPPAPAKAKAKAKAKPEPAPVKKSSAKAAAPAKKAPTVKPSPKQAAKAPKPTVKAAPRPPEKARSGTRNPIPKEKLSPPQKEAVASAKPAKPPVEKAPRTAEPALKGKEAVRARILAQRAKPAKPAAFSLDEVIAIAKSAPKAPSAPAATGSVIATKSGKTAPLPAHALQPPKPTTVRAASLADILGFNPKSRVSHAANEEASVPDKFKRYYKLLIELRNHVTGQVDQHSEETLKRSAKEDSGDLSSYGTDGGTDSFDRDFALSLVANEQEALAEIEAAIQRIKSGSYGVCEHTQQPINKERLSAVPFTRYTAAAMKEVEKTRFKVRGQTGILGEGEEGSTKAEAGDDE